MPVTVILVVKGAVMNQVVRLAAAAGVGALIATGVAALASPAPQRCSDSVESAALNRRFDDLDLAIANLQSQLGKAASDDALASANNGRQLATISNQVAVLSTTVTEISGRR
jgi:hypothetical protein